MENYKLSFASINKLENSIIEIVVNKVVTLNEAMKNEIKNLLGKIIDKPCGILENQKNKDVSLLPVIHQIGDVATIKAIAIIVYSSISFQYEMSRKDSFDNDYEINVFIDRYDAIAWLKVQLENEIQ
jgi:hypothetical protein